MRRIGESRGRNDKEDYGEKSPDAGEEEEVDFGRRTSVSVTIAPAVSSCEGSQLVFSSSEVGVARAYCDLL